MKFIVFLTCAIAISVNIYAQFPSPYCTETFPSGIRPITKVTFSNVINASPVSPAGPALENFTNITANVFIDRSYTISLEGSTGGNFSDVYSAYFDWNGDGDFNDAFEQQFIGTISNSSGTDGQKAISGITVPSSAVVGTSRMRIVKKYNTGTVPCNTTGFGQAEDYKLVIAVAPPASYYVKQNATGLNNGSSWANAFTNLTNAMYAALRKDTIRVAAGTYKPGTVQTNTFFLRDSMVVLGGYPSTGTPTDAQRNFSLNQTILSGEIGAATQDDNIYNIITIQDVSPGTVLDGFIIEKGNANYYNPDPDVAPGGGLKIKNSTLSVNNCVFRNNNSTSGGSAIASVNSNIIAKNCMFIFNGSTQDASTIMNKKNSMPVFTNCVFFHNNGTVAMNDSSKMTMKHCTIAKNELNVQNVGTVRAVNNSTIDVSNSIFYANGRNTIEDSTDISLNASAATVVNTITQVYNTGNNITLQNLNPKFRDTSNFIGADNLYFTADDGLQLTNPCSPAINAGSNTAAIGITTDIRGLPRLFGSAVDLGAYEMQSILLSKPGVLYVNKTAAGNNSGTSWANAFTDLQSAFALCSDTIKVAAGTYYPSQTDPLAAFILEKNRIVLGGYPTVGNPTNSQRDFTLNPTILSGNLPLANGNHSSILFKGRWLDSTAVADGFILSDILLSFYATQYNQASSAIYLIHHSSPTFKNCVLQSNTAYKGSCLNTQFFCNPYFYNCTFQNNLGINLFTSGAVTNYTNSAPHFLKCTFKNNSTEVGNTGDINGGAIYNDNATPTIDSCNFLGNTARNRGGAIYNLNNSNAIIKNSYFLDNVCQSYGSDIYNENSSPTITNCIFSDSLTVSMPFPTSYGGSIANLNNSNISITNSQFKNGRADFGGGALYNKNSIATLKNCFFSDNHSSVGTGIFNDNSTFSFIQCLAVKHTVNANYFSDGFISNKKSNVTITQCTIATNNSNVIENSDSTQLTIKNTIISNNNTGTQGSAPEIHNNPYQAANTTLISNSLTWATGTNGANGNIVGTQARFRDFENPAGPDGIFFTADDGLILSRCSPAINAGNNVYAAGIPADISGNARIFGGVVDMGAYEYLSNPTTSGSIYVNAAATGNNSGGSWANAYTSLTTALNNSCIDTIRVAEGTYKPIANRDSSFNFTRAKVIWGGYPATGSPTDSQRNPDLFPTILSGDLGIQNDSADNNYHVVRIAGLYTKLFVDGFKIMRGNADDLYNHLGRGTGGGVFCSLGETEWSNTKIENNYAVFGGGFFNTSKIKMNRVFFANNHSGTTGGAFYNSNSYNTCTVENTVFQNNVSDYQGGAIYEDVSTDSFRLANNLFLSNKAINGGGIFYNSPGSYLNNKSIITNCTFAKNACASNGSYGKGGAIYYIQGNNAIYNSLFYKNSPAGNTQVGEDIFDLTCNSNVACNSVEVQNNILEQWYPSNNANYYGAPIFTNENNPIGPDNKWFTNDDGYQLTFNSSGVNDGKNNFVTNIPFDILGNVRIYEDTVDIGAYEFANIPFANAGPDKQICIGGSVQIGTQANGVNNYSWTSSPSGFLSNLPKPTVSPNVTTSYFLQVTNGTITSRDTVVVVVNNLSAPTVVIAATATTICAGTFVTFTSSGTNQGTSPTYQWIKNGINIAGAVNSTLITGSLQNNDQISLLLGSSSACANVVNVLSNVIIISVTAALTPTITISSGPMGSCSGTAINFTATSTNGGTTPTYQWKVNGSNAGTNSPTFSTSTLNNFDVVTCLLTSSATCITSNNITSNAITITIANSVIPSVTILTSLNPACSGSQIVFNATPINGGSTPAYQWKVNGINAGTNNPTFTTSSLQNNDQVKVILTSSITCATPDTATSNIILMFVTPAPVANAGNDVTICSGLSTQLNGSGGTTYLWTPSAGLNNPNIANPIATPSVTTAYVLTATNGNCISRDTVLVSVNASSVPIINISASNTNICSSTSVTFNATPANGGTTPTYQWKVNGINAGTNSPLFTTGSIQNNDQVKVIMTSSLACAIPAVAISNTIIMSVTSAPVANAGNDVSICAGSSTQLIGSGGATYLWSPTTGLSNPNIANPVATTATTTSYILTVSNGICVSRDTVVIYVAQPTTLNVSITTANNNICEGSNASFTAVALNAGANPTYQWQVNGINAGTNSSTFTSNSLQNNAQVKVTVTSSGCTTTPIVTSNVITMSVTTLAQPIVSLNTNILTVTNPDAAAVYTWQVLTNTIWSNVGPTATGIVYTTTQPGEYRIKAEKSACTLYSVSQVSARTSTPDSTLHYIYLNPNPTRGLITVYKIVPSQKWQSLEVINLQGQIVLPSKNIRGLRSVPIRADNLAPGLYFVRLTNEDGRKLSYRFIKE